MKNPFKAISLAILIVTAAAPVIRAEANINEGQETATLYVDVVNGNDNNSGSQSEPLKTIGQSVAVAWPRRIIRAASAPTCTLIRACIVEISTCWVPAMTRRFQRHSKPCSPARC